MNLPIDFKLIPQQLEVLSAAFDGKDTIAVLPTGFGKSLIFQMLPFSFMMAVSGFIYSYCDSNVRMRCL